MAFLSKFLGATLLLCPIDGVEGSTGPAGGAGSTGSLNPDEPPAKGTPFATFPTQESLNERLARASRAELRKLFGTEDTNLILTRWAKLDQMEKAEEERLKAEMSEIDRLKAEKLAGEQEAATLRQQLETEKLERHIATQCSALGIKDVGYASYLIGKAAEELPDGEQLDVAKFLGDQLTDAAKKTALGIAAPVVTKVPDPVSTSPTTPLGTPPPPLPGGGGEPKDAMSMTSEEWNQHKSRLGI